MNKMSNAKPVAHLALCCLAVALTGVSLFTPWLARTEKVSVPTAGVYAVVATTTTYLGRVCYHDFPLCTQFDDDGDCIATEIGDACNNIDDSYSVFASLPLMIASAAVLLIAVVVDALHRRCVRVRSYAFVSLVTTGVCLNFASWSRWLATCDTLLRGILMQESYAPGHFLAVAAIGCSLASVIVYALVGRQRDEFVDLDDAGDKGVPLGNSSSLLPIDCVELDDAPAGSKKELSSSSSSSGTSNSGSGSSSSRSRSGSISIDCAPETRLPKSCCSPTTEPAEQATSTDTERSISISCGPDAVKFSENSESRQSGEPSGVVGSRRHEEDSTQHAGANQPRDAGAPSFPAADERMETDASTLPREKV